jgi:hypothetical protein
MTAQEEKVAVHPLLSVSIRPISDWREWLALWNLEIAPNYRWRESLLQGGFDTLLNNGWYHDGKEYDEADRLMFYLSVADGWTDEGEFRPRDDHGVVYHFGYDQHGNNVRKRPSELCQQLAHKAFATLCQSFFKKVELKGGSRGSSGFNEIWERLVTSEKFFPTLQNFFRAEKWRLGDDIDLQIRNLTRWNDRRSNNELLVVDFLLKLAEFLWGWQAPDTSWGYTSKEEADKRFAEMRIRLDAAKPWMVEVLAQLDRLDVLGRWMLELDETSLAKLKEIALRGKLSELHHPVTDQRRVNTIEEACLAGSKAAWFVKKHELLMAEWSRLAAILQAEREKAQAIRNLEELKVGKQ